MPPLGRRAVLAHTAAGSLAAFTRSNVPVWEAVALPARKLQVGDMITGPDATVVRVAQLHRLSSGHVRVRYTNPATGTTDDVTMGAHFDALGYPPSKKFVVYARGVDASAARAVPAQVPATPPAPPAPAVIDGGKP
jgi:hypothetical protein